MLFLLFAASVSAAIITIPIGGHHLPRSLIAKQGDELTFINIDDRVHRVSSKHLPGFDSQDLYPIGFSSARAYPHKFSYSLKAVEPGTYFYSDDYSAQMGRLFVEVWPPWENHPGYAGSAGPTRVVGARVPASRNNEQNQITPATVTNVTVEVWLSGTGQATLIGGLHNDAITIKADCTARNVDALQRRVETFHVDASSFPDGELSFEVELNGETYLIPGPVIKSTSAFFPETPFKKVFNVQLSK